MTIVLQGDPVIKQGNLLVNYFGGYSGSIQKLQYSTRAFMPKEVQKKCMAELKKLKNMSPMSAEATVVRNYLDWMTDIPWYKKDAVNIELNKAIKTLDEEKKIIEFRAELLLKLYSLVKIV